MPSKNSRGGNRKGLIIKYEKRGGRPKWTLFNRGPFLDEGNNDWEGKDWFA